MQIEKRTISEEECTTLILTIPEDCLRYLGIKPGDTLVMIIGPKGKMRKRQLKKEIRLR